MQVLPMILMKKVYRAANKWNWDCDIHSDAVHTGSCCRARSVNYTLNRAICPQRAQFLSSWFSAEGTRATLNKVINSYNEKRLRDQFTGDESGQSQRAASDMAPAEGCGRQSEASNLKTEIGNEKAL